MKGAKRKTLGECFVAFIGLERGFSGAAGELSPLQINAQELELNTPG